MNIAFIDLANDGHHWFYNYNIMSSMVDGGENKIYYFSSDFSKEQIVDLVKSNIRYITNKKFPKNNRLLIYFYEIYITFKFLVFCIMNSVKRVYFIHGDRYLFALKLLCGIFKIFKIEVIITLHWFPGKKVKIKWLNSILKVCDVLITHTDDVKNRILINNDNKYSCKMKVIRYPIMNNEPLDKSVAIKHFQFLKYNKEAPTILYFGATRYDKGLDILLKASKNLKNIYNIIIAGKAEYFDEEYILQNERLCKNVTFINKLEFIDENDIKYYFSCADIIVLPYRKIFNGESGILTESISFGKISVVPNIIHFPKIIQKYKNGIVYKCEDYLDLAKKLDLCYENINYYRKNANEAMEEYRKIHSLEKFKKRYLEILK
ncbi:glycosyltransferase [Clostridium felsineum]|uniref:glycosyltransferase n=1 Tax=Clostridium felsineum TaxID=36839 RepID=UPI00098CEC6B|nr:glycosyltransferase [Clostridium felsineum]URZ03540.1 hypothetical protein CLAUR_036010 [Clostridium felsineum]